MPTIFRSRRFSRQKDILHSKCDASKSTRECIFLPVVPTSTLGIRFERALVLLLFGEDDFGARSIQSSSSPESSSSCCARLVVVRRISLFVFVFFFFFFFGKKDYSFSFRPFCFGETKRRRDLFDSLSLSQKSSSSRRGFFFKGGLLLLSRSSSSFTSSANKKKDVLLASRVFERVVGALLRGGAFNNNAKRF